MKSEQLEMEFSTPYHDVASQPGMIWKPELATPEEFDKWRDTDYFSKMDFDPMLLCVVIPAIIQVCCITTMGICMFLITNFF
jgi:hypothetical protein|tara:strand:- start:140 stop:385 length:246 start_codon:yes stop_codon:yes gene_type:complete